jgi:hypothetical protein
VLVVEERGGEVAGVAVDAFGDSDWDPRVLLSLETSMEHGNEEWCAVEAAEVSR